MDKKFLTIAEIRDFFGITEQELKSAVDAGNLRALPDRGDVKFKREELEAWIRRRNAGPATEDFTFEDSPNSGSGLIARDFSADDVTFLELDEEALSEAADRMAADRPSDLSSMNVQYGTPAQGESDVRWTVPEVSGRAEQSPPTPASASDVVPMGSSDSELLLPSESDVQELPSAEPVPSQQSGSQLEAASRLSEFNLALDDASRAELPETLDDSSAANLPPSQGDLETASRLSEFNLALDQSARNELPESLESSAALPPPSQDDLEAASRLSEFNLALDQSARNELPETLDDSSAAVPAPSQDDLEAASRLSEFDLALTESDRRKIPESFEDLGSGSSAVLLNPEGSSQLLPPPDVEPPSHESSAVLLNPEDQLEAASRLSEFNLQLDSSDRAALPETLSEAEAPAQAAGDGWEAATRISEFNLAVPEEARFREEDLDEATLAPQAMDEAATEDATIAAGEPAETSNPSDESSGSMVMEMSASDVFLIDEDARDQIPENFASAELVQPTFSDVFLVDAELREQLPTAEQFDEEVDESLELPNRLSDVQVVLHDNPPADENDASTVIPTDSDVALVLGDEADLTDEDSPTTLHSGRSADALTAEVEAGDEEVGALLDPDSGLALDDPDSGLTLDAEDSGLTLEAEDSGLALERPDSGISLDAGDSGLALEVDSGLRLESGDSGLTLPAPQKSGPAKTPAARAPGRTSGDRKILSDSHAEDRTAELSRFDDEDDATNTLIFEDDESSASEVSPTFVKKGSGSGRAPSLSDQLAIDDSIQDLEIGDELEAATFEDEVAEASDDAFSEEYAAAASSATVSAVATYVRPAEPRWTVAAVLPSALAALLMLANVVIVWDAMSTMWDGSDPSPIGGALIGALGPLLGG